MDDDQIVNHSGVAQWLKFHDPHTNHMVAQRKKQPNTGLWFVRGEVYSGWRNGGISSLWISGSRRFGPDVLDSR